MDDESGREPPLHGDHESLGAKFTRFGGWEMPVHYGSIRDEHLSVRDGCGVFDVSHMGEVKVSGADASVLMQRLTTRDIDDLGVGRCHYSAVTDEDGVLLDDIVVYRLGGDEYLFVPNAGHDDEMTERWGHMARELNLDVEVENVTDSLCMFAVQGPDSVDVLSDICGGSPDDLDGFEWTRMDVAGVESMVSRTGYTGEDGFELVMPSEQGIDVWRSIEAEPCGLGSRDTLRLEMGYLLSGQDFNPDDNPRTPFEAGLGFVVDLDVDFVGRDALMGGLEEVTERITGFRLMERGVPRHGYSILSGDEEVGFVTSGTMSPSLREPIGLGYLPVELTDEGTEVDVEIRGDSKKAKVSSTPFIEKA